MSARLDLMNLEPVPALRRRIAAELGGAFDAARPVRIARAPGRLDVMGGIADYTGSLACEMPLGVGTAVALQERPDRQVSIFSFNMLDDHAPFQLGMSLDDLVAATADGLRRELGQPGRKWAAYVLGCLFLLHEKGFIDLGAPEVRGMHLAVLSTIPLGGGVSSSAALEVATMSALVDHFQVGALHGPTRSEEWQRKQFAVARWEWEGGAARQNMSPPPADRWMRLAELCQEVENRIVGAPCGIMDQVTCLLGRPGELLRLRCQPHELLPPLPLPAGVKLVGIFTGIRHSVAGAAYGRTRAAAFMGHRMVVEQMRRLGAEAGKTMLSDPTGGYLANLAPEDYKALFRPLLPASMPGREFLDRFGTHGDAATVISPEESYPVQDACDHHVLEARRVRRFADFLERAGEIGRAKSLRSAGHLMYASHHSYTEHAGLGHPAADVLVDLVKRHEPAGLYGAKITGGGGGGTVAVLMEATERADGAIGEILRSYEQAAGHRPILLDSTSPGAAWVGTTLTA
jgi:L-arabinokinase